MNLSFLTFSFNLPVASSKNNLYSSTSLSIFHHWSGIFFNTSVTSTSFILLHLLLGTPAKEKPVQHPLLLCLNQVSMPLIVPLQTSQRAFEDKMRMGTRLLKSCLCCTLHSWIQFCWCMKQLGVHLATGFSLEHDMNFGLD